MRKWEWDEGLIRARTVSDNVAELLTRRLLRLPVRVLKALRVMSIFGSKVPIQVLTHICDVCGCSDIIAELDQAVNEGLIKKTADTLNFAFVHDMIQQSVCMGIKPDESVSMLKEISQTLHARTSDGRTDDILFILVDLINRVGPEGACKTERFGYANLNLTAGEKVCISLCLCPNSWYL